MKEKKEITPKPIKAKNNPLLSEAAAKLSNKILFKEKVESAKAYLKRTSFPSGIKSSH